MLQQVYNTTRVQQEYSKKYNKSTARRTTSLYDIVILFNTLQLIQNIKVNMKTIFHVIDSFFSFPLSIKAISILAFRRWGVRMILPSSGGVIRPLWSFLLIHTHIYIYQS